jgi:hypothetical protein
VLQLPEVPDLPVEEALRHDQEAFPYIDLGGAQSQRVHLVLGEAFSKGQLQRGELLQGLGRKGEFDGFADAFG